MTNKLRHNFSPFSQVLRHMCWPLFDKCFDKIDCMLKQVLVFGFVRVRPETRFISWPVPKVCSVSACERMCVCRLYNGSVAGLPSPRLSSATPTCHVVVDHAVANLCSTSGWRA